MIFLLNSNYPSLHTIDEEIDFNFFHEFYNSRDSLLARVPKKNAKFSTLLQDTLNMFLKMFFANDFYVHNILNPALPDLAANSQHSTTSTASTYSHRIDCQSDFCFRFTIDFCRSIISNKQKLREQNQRLECELDVGQTTEIQSNEVNCSLLNATVASENCYNYLINDLISMGNDNSGNRNMDVDKIKSDMSIKFDLVKEKTKYLLVKKLNYFLQQQNKTSRIIELNEKLGNKILKNLEQNTSLSTIELDKYKLLVSESDVINNLLFKLSNKLATIENSIQIIELKHLQNSKYGNFDGCYVELKAEAIKELDLLKQEYNQIQRKKEEAIFLKNGINKREITVSDILVK